MVYLTEPIDEVTIQNLAKYGDHTFVDVSKEEIDLGEDEDEKAKASSLPDSLRTMPRLHVYTYCICCSEHRRIYA